jgi:hypothetical protein
MLFAGRVLTDPSQRLATASNQATSHPLSRLSLLRDLVSRTPSFEKSSDFGGTEAQSYKATSSTHHLQPYNFPALSMWGLWATKLRSRASEAAETIRSSVVLTVSSLQGDGLPVLENLTARLSTQSTRSSTEDLTSLPSTSSVSASESVLGCTTLEHRMEDLNLTSSSGVQEPARDQPVDLTTQPDNGVAATGWRHRGHHNDIFN